MPTTAPPLIDLEAFEAAARLGSFVAAARELHLTASAVSHRVKALEVFLGVPLFTRYARRIELTDPGRAYLPSVRRAFDELAASTIGLFGSVDVDRRVTVRAPISFAVRSIAPYLHEFAEQHPDIDVRLVSAIWADEIPPEATDVEVRYGHGRWVGQQAELLAVETAGPVWTPSFVRRYGPVVGVDSLLDRPRVHVLGYESLGRSRSTTNVPADITVDTTLAAIEVVRSGNYSSMLPMRFVGELVRSGEFQTDSDMHITMSESHYVLYPNTTRAPSAEAVLFVSWLRSLDPR
jgi:LysR family transcriptional regulator, glycine cleavage system transcriptional activator